LRSVLRVRSRKRHTSARSTFDAVLSLVNSSNHRTSLASAVARTAPVKRLPPRRSADKVTQTSVTIQYSKKTAGPHFKKGVLQPPSHPPSSQSSYSYTQTQWHTSHPQARPSFTLLQLLVLLPTRILALIQLLLRRQYQDLALRFLDLLWRVPYVRDTFDVLAKN
jgi:hypothetical protein